MTNAEHWYVVKRPEGHCDIVTQPPNSEQTADGEETTRWGPFSSQPEAIARRVGLIRAGKCQPL